MIPIAGISLLYNGLINGFIGWRAYRARHTTGNLLFQYYYQYSIILSIAFTIYGFFPTFMPENIQLLSASFIAGGVFVLISFAFLIRFIFLALNRKFLAVILPILCVLMAMALILLGLLYPKNPFIDQYGLYHPNQSIQFNVAFFSVIALITIPTGLLFIFSSFNNAHLKMRSLFLGIGFFVASIGSFLAITQNNTLMLASGFTLMTIGFTFMLFLFLFSPDKPENNMIE